MKGFVFKKAKEIFGQVIKGKNKDNDFFNILTISTNEANPTLFIKGQIANIFYLHILILKLRNMNIQLLD
jgi:hypothetical protein